MREVLEQLAGMSGVLGALACDGRGGLLASAFPPVFDEGALRRAAALLVQPATAGEALASPGDAVELRFARGRACARRWADGVLLVVGTVAADRDLLGLSMEQAVRRLEAWRPAAPPEDPPPAWALAPPAAAAIPRPSVAAPPAPSAATPAPPAVPAEVERARPRLRDALIRQIGPYGGMAFEDRWAAWCAAAPPSRARLVALLDDLGSEIDDREARLAFFTEAGKALG